MTDRQRAQRGFTLIELLIVVAILGVLSAIALPMYRDYVIRSKMSEPLEALAEAKVAVSGYVAASRGFPADVRAFGIDFTTRNSDVVHSLSWAPDTPQSGDTVYIMAEIYAGVFDGGPNDAANLLAFQLSGSTNADGSMRWECIPGYGSAGERAVPLQYLPSSCKG